MGGRALWWVGVLPALSVFYVRYFVKEPPVWVENRRLQRTQHREGRTPFFSIFKRGMLGSTLTACWFMAGGLVLFDSVQPAIRDRPRKGPGRSPASVGATD